LLDIQQEAVGHGRSVPTGDGTDTILVSLPRRFSMGDAKRSAPGFVILQRMKGDSWTLVGEADRRRGLPARAARSQAILDASGGKARPGDVYAAVLRSEWRVAMDWKHPEA
jgi:hypothetical protein